MLRLLGRLLLWMKGGSLTLLIWAGLLLLIWGTLSPVGTLVWWLRQGSESLNSKKNKPDKLINPAKAAIQSPQSPEINCYIVFLTGLGDFSTDQLTPGETRFLNQLDRSHPNCVSIRDVFPYSASNESLGEKAVFGPLWNFAEQADGWLKMADVLIKIRNFWRFALSADDRYGDVYNQGIAKAIVNRIDAKLQGSTPPGKPVQVVLIGTSGGAQVALGALPYLNHWLDARIYVISIGGVFSGTEGFDQAKHVYHLKGSQDWVENIGAVIFASRWPWTVGSPFNRSLWDGKYTAKAIGSHEHDGEKGYFGLAIAKPEGVAYVDLTLQQVNQLPIWSYPR